MFPFSSLTFQSSPSLQTFPSLQLNSNNSNLSALVGKLPTNQLSHISSSQFCTQNLNPFSTTPTNSLLDQQSQLNHLLLLNALAPTKAPQTFQIISNPVTQILNSSSKPQPLLNQLSPDSMRNSVLSQVQSYSSANIQNINILN